MKKSIKNPDIAAMVSMVAILIAESASHFFADKSLLAQLPACAAPTALAVAAAIRLYFTNKSKQEKVEKSSPEIPSEILAILRMLIVALASSQKESEQDTEKPDA